MKNIGKMKFLAAGLASVMAFTTASGANAAVTINVKQSGSNVLAEASGSLNLDGLTRRDTNSGVNGIVVASSRILRVGNGRIDIVDGLRGPSNFGAGGAFTTSIREGDPFGISGGSVWIPSEYVSGSDFFGMATYANHTISSLGLLAGIYVFTTPNDTITLNIFQAVAPSVPEPATWGMMILGFGLIGAGARSRKTKTTVSYG